MDDLVHVKGLRELGKALQTLPDRIQRGAMRGALRAGAKVVRDAARENINSVSGDLARSLKLSTRSRGTEVKASVGTKLFYARFVEFGTRQHAIGPRDDGSLYFGGRYVDSVDHPGARPHPFLRPAIDAQASAAVAAVGQYLKLRLATKHGLDTSEIDVEEVEA